MPSSSPQAALRLVAHSLAVTLSRLLAPGRGRPLLLVQNPGPFIERVFITPTVIPRITALYNLTVLPLCLRPEAVRAQALKKPIPL